MNGRCMCGGVVFAVDGPLRNVWNCHCLRCRQFTGHHMAATQAAASDVTITGETLAWFAPEPSVEYGFCRVCGSSLFWRIVGGPRLSICAGTLHQPTGLRTDKAWWVAEVADYHDRAAGVVEYDYED